MWRFRTGSPWRDVPARYGHWSTIYDRFRIWARAGVLQNLMEAMIAEAAVRGDVELDLVSVDSTVSRAHHHAAGMVVAPELLQELEKAVAAEKGLHQRDKTDPRTDPETRLSAATPAPAMTSTLSSAAAYAAVARPA